MRVVVVVAACSGGAVESWHAGTGKKCPARPACPYAFEIARALCRGEEVKVVV